MPLYVESTEQANQQHNITLTPENLQTLLSTEEIDGNTRSEYQQTLTELTNITQSLRSLSENPELYISPQTTPANENAFHINL